MKTVDVTVEENKKLKKEITKLKIENKKLKAALDEEGIEPNTEVLGKKIGNVLTGKELRIAAEKKLKVRYIEHYHNPHDKHMNFNADCVMEECGNNTDNYRSYYIGNSDICLDDYDDDQEVSGDFDEGTFEVRRAKGVKYS